MKKSPEFNVEREIRGAIRRVFVRSPIIREVLMAVRQEVPKFNLDGSRSKKDAVQYQCALCSLWTKSTEVSVDHIHPVVSVEEGFIDFNTFVTRLFCSKENLQVICNVCHEKKTYKERIDRLSKQYTKELEKLAQTVADVVAWPAGVTAAYHKELMKKLTTLASKKKVKELEPVAERAAALKATLKTIKPKWESISARLRACPGHASQMVSLSAHFIPATEQKKKDRDQ